jgi:hypothetical protein
MNVDNFNTIGFYLIVGLEVFFMYKYAKCWLQILSTIKEEDGEQSMYSQEKLNDAAMRGDFKQGYGMIFSKISVSTKILFSSETKNPKIKNLVKGVRRTLFLAILTPIIIFLVLIFVTALMQ